MARRGLRLRDEIEDEASVTQAGCSLRTGKLDTIMSPTSYGWADGRPPTSIMYRLKLAFKQAIFVQGGLRSHFLCCRASQRPDAGFPAETSLRKHRAILLWRGFLVAAVAAPHFPRFFWSQGFTFHWGHRQTMIMHDISRLSKD